MKKRVALPLLVVLLAAVDTCRSFDAALWDKKEMIHADVPPMRVIVNYDSIAACYPGSSNLFINKIANAIKNNLYFEKKDDNKYLSIIVRKVKHDSSASWIILDILTLDIGMLLGVPIVSENYDITLSAAVMSANGEILKTYESAGNDTEYCAAYYGYSGADSNTAAMYQSLALACKHLREQLKKDANTIKLLAK